MWQWDTTFLKKAPTCAWQLNKSPLWRYGNQLSYDLNHEGMEINYHTISTMKVPKSLNNCSLNLKITKEQKSIFVLMCIKCKNTCTSITLRWIFMWNMCLYCAITIKSTTTCSLSNQYVYLLKIHSTISYKIYLSPDI
jgi:hypothetical protein